MLMFFLSLWSDSCDRIKFNFGDSKGEIFITFTMCFCFQEKLGNKRCTFKKFSWIILSLISHSLRTRWSFSSRYSRFDSSFSLIAGFDVICFQKESTVVGWGQRKSVLWTKNLKMYHSLINGQEFKHHSHLQTSFPVIYKVGNVGIFVNF